MPRTFIESNDTDKLLSKQTSLNSQKAEKNNISVFQEYLNLKGVELATISLTDLDTILTQFYPSVRKLDGGKFKAGSLRTMKNYIKMYLIRENSIDLNDSAFHKSNTVFENYIKVLKKEGLGTTVHYKDVSSDDLKKVVTTLSTDTPVQLQYLLFIQLMVFFGFRGEENLDRLKKDDFAVVELPDGKKYLHKTVDYGTKNHQSGSEKTGDSKIYSSNNPKDAVNVFQKYVSKLNNQNTFLWQQPKYDFLEENTCWYMNKKYGHNSIGDFMKKISHFCQLSHIYTNHCLRATTCTILGDSYSDTDVQSVSGHKSCSSLAIYKRPREQKQKQMSDTLSTELGLIEPECKERKIEQQYNPETTKTITTEIPATGMQIINYGTINIVTSK